MTAKTITVTGHGVAIGTPDIAYITLGVESMHVELSEAWNRTSQAITSVLDRLRSFEIDTKDIRTTGLSVYQRSHRPRKNEPEVQEYVVRNTVFVTLRDISRVPEILGTVVSGGANTFYGLAFDVADRSALAAMARENAAKDARRRAEELASALGVTIGRALKINDSENLRRPTMLFKAGAADQRHMSMNVEMPVSGGSIEEHATVRVVFRLKPQSVADGEGVE